MKLWDVNGTIKCGHRLYNVQKFIIADNAMDAVAMYRKEHPQAKCLQVHFKYELQKAEPQIIFTNLRKKS